MLSIVWTMWLNSLTDVILTSVMITGMVVVMMLMIESLNIKSRGRWFDTLKRSKVGQVFVSALLGIIPGCMGGFASVSLYSHGMISFGALVAMMIATSGDEAFVMLAMFPAKTFRLMLVLFVIAVVAGLTIDTFRNRRGKRAAVACSNLNIHDSDSHESPKSRHFGWKRVTIAIVLILYTAALAFGLFDADPDTDGSKGLNLLNERWMNIMFACFSLLLLVIILFASDHFVDEHLWNHIVLGHLPRIFLWTFGALMLVEFCFPLLDIDSWIGSNIPLMIVIASLVGIIPESGPHLIFVTLFAAGVVPAPVLLASCISQDGHASLPLLAESRKAFLAAKAVNCILAVAAGLGMYWVMA